MTGRRAFGFVELLQNFLSSAGLLCVTDFQPWIRFWVEIEVLTRVAFFANKHWRLGIAYSLSALTPLKSGGSLPVICLSDVTPRTGRHWFWSYGMDQLRKTCSSALVTRSKPLYTQSGGKGISVSTGAPAPHQSLGKTIDKSVRNRLFLLQRTDPKHFGNILAFWFGSR